MYSVSKKYSDPFYIVSYYIKWITIILGHTVIIYNMGKLDKNSIRDCAVHG